MTEVHKSVTLSFKLGQAHEDPKKAVIEKRGHVIAFTLEEIEEHERDLQKFLKELGAQHMIEDAKATNVVQNHPDVLEIPEEQRVAVHIYQSADTKRKMLADKMKEIQEQIDEYAKEKAEIFKQIPELNGPVTEQKEEAEK